MDWDSALRVLTGLGTVSIAVIGVVIARRQAKTAHDKLKLDLFDRRFAVYTEVRNILHQFIRETKIDIKEIGLLHRQVELSRFLFDDAMPAYIQTIIDKVVRARSIKNELELDRHNMPPEKRTPLVEEDNAILSWVAHQFDDLHKPFAPYLHFGNVQ